MTEFQREVLDAHGYEVGATCAQDNDPPELCPALSLPDLFRSGPPEQQESVRALLDAVPPYFSQAVITSDRTTATLAFGIRLMPLDRQKEVIDDIEEPARPAGGRRGRRRRPARAGRRGERHARRPAAALPHAARGAPPRVRRALRGPPLDARGRDPADPDRARDRLVGARPVPAADPAQPDVGGDGRARDRDLDRVQRAAVGALPRGARGRAPSRTRRSTRPTPRPARPCSPRASRRSWASPR